MYESEVGVITTFATESNWLTGYGSVMVSVNHERSVNRKKVGETAYRSVNDG